MFTQTLPLNQATVSPKHQVFIDLFKKGLKRVVFIDNREMMYFYSGILFEDREQGVIVQQILMSVKLGYKFGKTLI